MKKSDSLTVRIFAKKHQSKLQWQDVHALLRHIYAHKLSTVIATSIMY